MRYRNREDSQQEINISPLIDIVFILLIFFMVTATFVKDMDIEINRPKAQSAEISSSKAIRVYIDNAGDTFLEGEAVRTWVLQSHLRKLLKFADPKTVLVVTDEKVPVKNLIDVVDQARLAGAVDVGVVTDKEGG